MQKSDFVLVSLQSYVSIKSDILKKALIMHFELISYTFFDTYWGLKGKLICNIVIAYVIAYTLSLQI